MNIAYLHYLLCLCIIVSLYSVFLFHAIIVQFT